MNTLKTICYPSSKKFGIKATKWFVVIKNMQFLSILLFRKQNMRILMYIFSGFVISIEYSFLGAAPGSTDYCECCGRGTLEIKCPFVSEILT